MLDSAGSNPTASSGLLQQSKQMRSRKRSLHDIALAAAVLAGCAAGIVGLSVSNHSNPSGIGGAIEKALKR